MFQLTNSSSGSLPVENDRFRNDENDAAAYGFEKISVCSDPDLTYYLFEARRPCATSPLLVCVHGINRQAEEQVRLFAPLVDAIGGTLVVPFFPQKRFPDYQRLGRQGRGDRSDLALQRVLSDAAARTGKTINSIAMFGYSGGGQFVHRYAMAYPRQVERMAIAAPGWYTFPMTDSKFPQGLKKTEALPDLTFDPARFLKIPALVLVGEKDVSRDEALNRSARIDLRQGKNRMERARRWISSMSKAAAQYQYDTTYEFLVVPDCGHSFTECMTKGVMGPQIIAFLTGRPEMPAEKANHGS